MQGIKKPEWKGSIAKVKSGETTIIKTYKDLNVYQLSYSSAMEIFNLVRKFPKDESYSLIDQVRRASRSIPANIGEGWAKRKYENVFFRYLYDAYGSCEETKVWLDFAKDCKYIVPEEHKSLAEKYDQAGAMLYALVRNWKTF